MPAKRHQVSTGTSWERAVGYSRAVRIGPHVHVSGTTAIDLQGHLVGEGDAYTQARYILRKIEAALLQAGACLKDVVRTRIYVTDIDHWQAVGRAHEEVFRDIRPASTLVAVSRLVWPEMLVEIDADAYVVE